MLGAVVTSFNDGFKLKEWKDHYQEMKASIGRYIIVDNGSDIDYIKQIKEEFPQADIIELGCNKGTTGAYNAGISKLLSDHQIDHIMLIGNDIRISCDSIALLETVLDENKKIGMVTPILLKKDSDLIEDGGCSIDISEYALRPSHVGEKYVSAFEQYRIVDTVTGGMNIAKREFYEKVGLQDEKLFMYSDEVDMGLRAKNYGYQMAIVTNATAWHQHINPKNTIRRHPYSAYLMGRNKIYLAYKHARPSKAYALFAKYILRDIKQVVFAKMRRDSERVQWVQWHFIGACHGLIHDMRKNKYSSLEG